MYYSACVTRRWYRKTIIDSRVYLLSQSATHYNIQVALIQPELCIVYPIYNHNPTQKKFSKSHSSSVVINKNEKPVKKKISVQHCNQPRNDNL